MVEQDFVLALSPDGTTVEIFDALYGRGLEAQIPAGTLTAESCSKIRASWRKALARSFFGPPEFSIGRGGDDDPETESYDVEAEGQRLFDLLLPDRLHRSFRLSAEAARRARRPLRVRLLLRPKPDFEFLHAVPWELAWDGEFGDSLARHLQTPFARAPLTPRAEERTIPDPPLRVLLAFPRDGSGDRLGVHREAREIEAGLRRAAIQIEVEAVPAPVTLEALHKALANVRPHVLHFGGHGAIERHGNGVLHFQGRGRELAPVSGKVFAETLKSCRELGLVVLNACHSASSPAGDDAAPRAEPGVAVAEAVLASSHVAVLAMQAPIRGRAARSFSEFFYDRLAGGEALDVAANLARNHLFAANPESPEWATPVVFLRSGDARVVPPAGEPPRTESPARRAILNVSHLVRSKTRDFVGRGFAFEEIDDFLASDGGCLLVEGDPGIGKTTLLAEFLRRRRPLHHFVEWRSRSASTMEHAWSNLTAQLIVHFGLPDDALPLAARADSRVLLQQLEQVADQRSTPRGIVLLVDALDELDEASRATTTFIDFPRTLPRHVYFILSKRRDKDLDLRFDDRFVELQISHDAAENLRDIEAYISRLMPRARIVDYRREHGLSAEQLTDLLVERSDGNFMYLRHVMLEIEDGKYRHEDPDALPRGLENYYRDHWRRLKERSDESTWFDLELPVLAAVTQVREPVSLDFIAAALGRPGDHGRIAAALEGWSQFLHVQTEDSAPHRNLYQLYHGSFHDFVRKQDTVAGEQVRLLETSRLIQDYVRREFLKSETTRRDGSE